MNSEKIKKIFTEAEELVQGIKDTSLKVVAFGKILDFLLSDHSSEMEPTSPKRVLKTKSMVSKNKSRGASQSKPGPKVWMADIISEGFFRTPKAMPDLKAELASQGHVLDTQSIQPYLKIFMNEKKLRRTKQLHKELKIKIWHYTNW